MKYYYYVVLGHWFSKTPSKGIEEKGLAVRSGTVKSENGFPFNRLWELHHCEIEKDYSKGFSDPAFIQIYEITQQQYADMRS